MVLYRAGHWCGQNGRRAGECGSGEAEAGGVHGSPHPSPTHSHSQIGFAFIASCVDRVASALPSTVPYTDPIWKTGCVARLGSTGRGPALRPR
eukprot:3700566-Prymnesium_polylepis.2